MIADYYYGHYEDSSLHLLLAITLNHLLGSDSHSTVLRKQTESCWDLVVSQLTYKSSSLIYTYPITYMSTVGPTELSWSKLLTSGGGEAVPTFQVTMCSLQRNKNHTKSMLKLKYEEVTNPKSISFPHSIPAYRKQRFSVRFMHQKPIY